MTERQLSQDDGAPSGGSGGALGGRGAGGSAGAGAPAGLGGSAAPGGSANLGGAPMSGAGGQALATDAGAVDGPGGSGGCNASSCGAREACSAASGRCEPLASDCPAIAAVPPPDGDLSFVRVRFDASGSAEVLIQNAGTGLLNLAAERTSLCNGSGNCVILVEGVSLTLLPGSTFSKTLPRTLPSGGELAIVTNDPLGEFTFAFVAWGTGAGANSFDAGGAAAGYWTLGARFAIDAADTGFVCTGNTSNAASYVSCNP